MYDVKFSGRELKKETGAKHRKSSSPRRVAAAIASGVAVFLVLTGIGTFSLNSGLLRPLSLERTTETRAFIPPAPVDTEIEPLGSVSAEEQAWIENIRELSRQQQEEAAEKKRQQDELYKQQLAAAAQAKLTASVSAPGSTGGGGAYLLGDQSQAQAIEIYLTEVDSPLVGYGRAFVSAGRAYGVDPFLVVSIAGKESSWGKDCFLPFNAWGWGDVTFKTWEDAIFGYTRMLSEEYISKGRTTPAVIGPIYCPPNYGEWIQDVNRFYAELSGIHTAVQR